MIIVWKVLLALPVRVSGSWLVVTIRRGCLSRGCCWFPCSSGHFLHGGCPRLCGGAIQRSRSSGWTRWICWIVSAHERSLRVMCVHWNHLMCLGPVKQYLVLLGMTGHFTLNLVSCEVLHSFGLFMSCSFGFTRKPFLAILWRHGLCSRKDVQVSFISIS